MNDDNYPYERNDEDQPNYNNGNSNNGNQNRPSQNPNDHNGGNQNNNNGGNQNNNNSGNQSQNNQNSGNPNNPNNGDQNSGNPYPNQSNTGNQNTGNNQNQGNGNYDRYNGSQNTGSGNVDNGNYNGNNNGGNSGRGNSQNNPNAGNVNQDDASRGNYGDNYNAANNGRGQGNPPNYNSGNGNNGNIGNNGNFEQKPEDNSKRNIIIAVLATLAVAVAAYFLFFNKKEKKTTERMEMAIKDTATAVAIAVDSPQIKKDYRNEDGEYEEQEYVTESYVIANEAFLRSAPSASADTKVRSMKFGEKVYAKNTESNNGYTTVYLTKPANEKNISEQPYYLLESTVVSQYEYAQFKEYFSIPPFSTLASKTKKLILEKNYSDGIDYKVTQNADRAKNALAYGDFDKDGITDIAIVLDNNEKQASRLLIICTNKATQEPYLAFAENYGDKVKINSFKKGSSIFMDTDEFISSPNDGLIVKGEDIKMALIYNNSLQKFKSFYQE